MIDLVFPLSLPPSSNDHDGRDKVRRQHALASLCAALKEAGLQRSRRTSLQPEGSAVNRTLAHETWLQEALRCATADEANTLSLRAQGVGLAPAASGRQAWLLRPVHLHLGLDHLVLAAGEANSFALDKPGEWIERLSEALEPGWALEAWSGPRGETFLRLETPAGLDWHPRSAVQATGRSIEVYLPQGADARLWRRFLNHAQMLLHEHPLNEARARQGKLPVNGLWLEGRIADGTACPLRRLLRSEISDLPEMAMPHARDQKNNERMVLYFEDWISPAQQGDAQAWLELWQSFPEVARQLRIKLAHTPSLNWHFFGETGRLSLQSSPGDNLCFWRRPLPSSL